MTEIADDMPPEKVPMSNQHVEDSVRAPKRSVIPFAALYRAVDRLAPMETPQKEN